MGEKIKYQNHYRVNNELLSSTVITKDLLIKEQIQQLIKGIPNEKLLRIFNVELIDVEHCEKMLSKYPYSYYWLSKREELLEQNRFEITTSIEI